MLRIAPRHAPVQRASIRKDRCRFANQRGGPSGRPPCFGRGATPSPDGPRATGWRTDGHGSWASAGRPRRFSTDGRERAGDKRAWAEPAWVRRPSGSARMARVHAGGHRSWGQRRVLDQLVAMADAAARPRDGDSKGRRPHPAPTGDDARRQSGTGMWWRRRWSPAPVEPGWAAAGGPVLMQRAVAMDGGTTARRAVAGWPRQPALFDDILSPVVGRARSIRSRGGGPCDDRMARDRCPGGRRDPLDWSVRRHPYGNQRRPNLIGPADRRMPPSLTPERAVRAFVPRAGASNHACPENPWGWKPSSLVVE